MTGPVFRFHVTSCEHAEKGYVHFFMRAMEVRNMRLRKVIVVQKPDRVLNAT